MKSVLALVLGVSMFVSPLAMAGELGSGDSNFLFSKDQVVATAISSQEMQDTEGRLLDNVTIEILNSSVILPILSSVVGSITNSTVNDCLNFLAGCSLAEMLK